MTLTLGCALLAGGCDSTADLARPAGENSASGPSTGPSAGSGTAARILNDTLAAYQKLEHYSDSGRVVLSYQFDGKPIADVAPMSVAFDRTGRLGIRAYMVSAGPDKDRWHVRIANDFEAPLGEQLLSRKLSDKLTFETISEDPILEEYLSAGLVGMPPQLPLLLSREPLRNIVDDRTQLSVVGSIARDGKPCTVLELKRDDKGVRWWIDSRDLLVRRIELPRAALPPAMLADKRISDVHLTIELDEVRTDNVDWDKWRVTAAPKDKLVRRFVLPPPSGDSRFGKTLPAFDLDPATEGPVHHSGAEAGAGRIQVLLWAADHPACKLTWQQIQAVLKDLPTESLAKISPVMIWAEPEAPAEGGYTKLKSEWQVNEPIYRDSRAVGRDIFGIQEAPSVVVIDSKHRLQYFQQRAGSSLSVDLKNLLTQLLSGQDPSGIVATLAQEAHRRYQAELWQSRAVDALPENFHKPIAYSPAFVKFEELQRIQSRERIVALGMDRGQSIWSLLEDGGLQQTDLAGKVLSRFSLAWKPGASASVRMQISGDEKSIALIAADDAVVHLVDTKSKSDTSVDLGERGTVVDFRWIESNTAASQTTSQLAVITDRKHVLLIDPKQTSPLSGRSEAQPLAILPALPANTNAATNAGNTSLAVNSKGSVILADGRIEPMLTEPGDRNGAQGIAVRPVSKVTSPSAADKESVPVKPNHTAFAPDVGPWSIWQDGSRTAILARGKLNEDEPAVFMLNDDLLPIWHAPLPISSESGWMPDAAARHPVTGKLIWITVQPRRTLHLFSEDGRLADHAQFDQTIVGTTLIPIGNELQLIVAHPNAIVRYRVSMP
ncbi:MAG: hypothetical protein U0892_07130 [Pirellulales bacterium]